MTDRKPIKSALITGGTDGIGKEIARGLVRAGHCVIIVGRDSEKGARAESNLRETTGNRTVHFIQADLTLMSEAHRLVSRMAADFASLHYLVHSAGIVRGRWQLTSEGIESNFAVNYLSRFALTTGLLPILEAGRNDLEPSRILIIGGAALNGTIHFDDVNLSRKFNILRAVSQFCQANDVFVVELERRLALLDGAKQIMIVSLKMGVVKTNIRREFPWWMKLLVPLIMDPLLGQTPHVAAASALRLLQEEEFAGMTGALFLKIRKLKCVAPSARTLDSEQGLRLWELSERLIMAASLHKKDSSSQIPHTGSQTQTFSS